MLGWVENIVSHSFYNQHFLLFPQCFQKLSFLEVFKVRIVWYWVNNRKKKTFNNIVGKGDIACNQQFVLFLQCFLPFQIENQALALNLIFIFHVKKVHNVLFYCSGELYLPMTLCQWELKNKYHFKWSKYISMVYSTNEYDFSSLPNINILAYYFV